MHVCPFSNRFFPFIRKESGSLLNSIESLNRNHFGEQSGTIRSWEVFTIMLSWEASLEDAKRNRLIYTSAVRTNVELDVQQTEQLAV